ncbi:hypothetical protein [Akkermansia muciniphila]|uniref:hypothetical protein n=1 Tax=Akkermansia muciniphila TaxID=239935 RepID=UPI0011AF1489|nr:hypothetical protein [Akkermansia muciniphila]
MNTFPPSMFFQILPATGKRMISSSPFSGTSHPFIMLNSHKAGIPAPMSLTPDRVPAPIKNTRPV